MAGPVYSLRPIHLLISLFLAASFSFVNAAVPSAGFNATGNTGDPNNNVTFLINVPQNSTDQLFVHFSAPAAQQWAAFGFGSQMQGSLIFVTYTSENGKNVTVSPRLGTGHSMPQYTQSTQFHLLEGSGIVNGTYVVNGFCTGCRSWNSGSVDVNSNSQSMIWAVGPIEPLESDDLTTTIKQHEAEGQVSVNLAAAKGDGGVPTLGNSSTSTTSSATSDGPGDFHAGVAFHALLMIVAFLLVFPGGYLFLRVLDRVWLHWSMQSLGAVLVIVGSTAGIVLSIKKGFNPNLNSAHQVVGFIVLFLVICSWLLGFISHRIYKRTGQPAQIMKAHRVLGPATMFVGLINADLGFNFAGHTGAIVGFTLVSILMIIVVITSVHFKRKRDLRKQAMNSAAAQNFRQGQMEPQYAGQNPGYGQAIPLDTYGQPTAPPVYR